MEIIFVKVFGPNRGFLYFSFFPKYAFSIRGSNLAMVKGPVNKCLGVRGGLRLVSSRLRFSYFFEKIVQQYRTSAFWPSKTRRKIDMFFENVSTHVVKLTTFLPMCHITSYNLYVFCKCVKTHRKINICIRRYVKTRRKIYIGFANVSKHVVQFTWCLQMCQNTS